MIVPPSGARSGHEEKVKAVDSELTLRDGRTVHLRPLRRGDSPAVADAFLRLSEQSARWRFGAPPRVLNAAALHWLVDAVDGVDHVAFAAFATGDEQPSARSRPGGADGAHPPRIVGIGRILRYPDDRDSLDVAITVADDYQGTGLGRVLADLLAAHRPRPARRIHTQIASGNERALALLGSFGPTHRRSGDGDVVIEFED